MKIRKLKESNTLKNYEIADILVANGFGNEEEGFLDYYLEDNPKYVASVNLEDMGAYVDDLDEGEHIPLPFANGSDRKVLKTEYDVNKFLDFIQELNYSDMFESVKRNRRMTEEIVDTSDDEDIVDELYTDLTDMVETMLVQLQKEINDIKYDVEHARNIDDDKAYYGIRNAKQSLDNVSTYLSYVRGAIIF